LRATLRVAKPLQPEAARESLPRYDFRENRKRPEATTSGRFRIRDQAGSSGGDPVALPLLARP